MSLRTRQVLGAGLAVGALLLLLSLAGRARLRHADFVMNNGAEIQSLDPAQVTGVPEGRVLRAIFEGLVTKDPATLAPLPGMAERWEISPDGHTYTFHIREDAWWSVPGIDPARFGEHGRAVTADDFVYSWRRVLEPETAAEYAYQLWYVRGARAYTSTPPADFAADDANPLWLSESLDEGTTRQLGATLWEPPPGGAGDALDTDGGSPSTGALHLLVKAGDAFAAGTPLVAVEGGDPWLAPVAGTVLRVAEDAPATLAELHAAPGSVLLDARVDAAALAAARAAGTLEDDATARDRLFARHVGISAPDPHTLQVELENPTPYFLSLCGFYPLFPVQRENIEEARRRYPETWRVEWLKPENLVVNGPYRILARHVNDRIRLVKNPIYWDADHVAMRTIDVLAVEGYQTMLNMYLTGEVDWIDRVATNFVPRLMQREDFDPEPYLGTYFYRVNVTRPPLDDRRVRRALALAIDRKAIVEKILKGGQIPNWGLVPHGMKGYPKVDMDHVAVKPDLSDYASSFMADVSNAKQLLREAGYYPGGKTMRPIEIHYNTSEAHRDIAEVIADSWRRNLGIEVNLLNQEWKVYLDTQSKLEYDVSRSAWIGDYADPNTFLDLFVTGGENNKTGWGDKDYDRYIAAARREPDPEKRLAILAHAERLLMRELPILPIYTYTTQNVVRPRLGGFDENLVDEHFPKFFYWMDDAELAEKRASGKSKGTEVDPGGPAAGLYPPAGRDAVVRSAAQ